MDLFELIIKLAFSVGVTFFIINLIISHGTKDKKWQSWDILSKKERARNFFRKIHEKHESQRKIENKRFNFLVFCGRIKPAIITVSIALVFGLIFPFIVGHNKLPNIIGTKSGSQTEKRNKPETSKQQDIGPKVAWSSKDENIYYWTDRNGQKHYTNERTAPAEPVVTPRTTRNSRQRETPVVIKNNSIMIPAIIENNGVRLQVTLVLDTGCSRTLIHYSVAQQIQPTVVGKVNSIIADGSISEDALLQFGALEVGPFREENFVTSTKYVQNEQALGYNGLLGMAFLKKHPFQIDMQRSVVRWL